MTADVVIMLVTMVVAAYGLAALGTWVATKIWG